MSARHSWSLVVVASVALMGVLLAADAGGPIRLLAALWFLLFCPGLSFVWLLPVRTRGEELAMAFVVSIAIDTVVATIILLIGDLSGASAFIALAGLCLIGCSMSLRGATPQLESPS